LTHKKQGFLRHCIPGVQGQGVFACKPLLVADTGYDLHKAAEFVMNQLAPVIPGESWQGRAQKPKKG
jgi:hypothetical protein